MLKGIEGIPVIIRFKTLKNYRVWDEMLKGIEGIPVIIRFKTKRTKRFFYHHKVLKVFQL